MDEFMRKLKDYIQFRNNKSELILVHTLHPVFEYKDVLSETRRILALFLNKSNFAKSVDEIISSHMPVVARQHIENLLTKFLNIDEDKKIVGFTALFEILMILKRELTKEKNDEMKYSHFLCTLERANQEKLKMAIVQLKCVPCLNKFTTNFNLINNGTQGGIPNSNSSSSLNNSSLLNQSINNKNMVSHANMSRLLKQMSLIVSTELQQIAIDLVERLDEDKLVKFIRLKDEFRQINLNTQSQQQQMSHHQTQQQQQQQPISQPKYSSITNKLTLANSTSQAAILLKQQHRQINGQLRSLPAQMSQMSFNNNNKQSDHHSNSSNNSNQSNQQRDYNNNNNNSSSRSGTPNPLLKPNNIFNPYKAMSQYKTDEKVMSLTMSSLQHTLPDRRQENLA